jgi:hypothetical protein
MRPTDFFIIKNWSWNFCAGTPELFAGCVTRAAQGNFEFWKEYGVPAKHIKQIAAEVVQSERVLQQWDDLPVRVAPDAGDLALAAMAEIHLHAAARHEEFTPDGRPTPWLDGRFELLRAIVDSPHIAISVYYGELFEEIASRLAKKGDPAALRVIERALAHNITFEQGSNLAPLLLAFVENAVMLGGEHSAQGIQLWAELIRREPANPWPYNAILFAATLTHQVEIGMAVYQRASSLFEAIGDEHELRVQMTELHEDLTGSRDTDAQKPLEPSAWTELRDALTTPFDTPPRPIDEAAVTELLPAARSAFVKELLDVPPEVVWDGIEIDLTPAPKPHHLKRAAPASSKEKNKRKAARKARKNKR